MPTYEYHCIRCGVCTYKQSILDKPIDACPQCGLKVQRLISGGRFVTVKGEKIESPYYEEDQILWKSK